MIRWLLERDFLLGVWGTIAGLTLMRAGIRRIVRRRPRFTAEELEHERALRAQAWKDGDRGRWSGKAKP